MVVKETVQIKTAECPDCGEKVPVKAPIELGQRVVCPNCMADLEVVETIPVELDWYDEDAPPKKDDPDWWR